MVYLLHFDRPYRAVQHYLGVTVNHEAARLIAANPTQFTSSGLLAAAAREGITCALVAVWDDGHAELDSLRKRLRRRQLCPTCQFVPPVPRS